MLTKHYSTVMSSGVVDVTIDEVNTDSAFIIMSQTSAGDFNRSVRAFFTSGTNVRLETEFSTQSTKVNFTVVSN